MKSKEELISLIEEYSAKYKNSRNIQEKAIFSEKVALYKKELKKLDEKPMVKDYVVNRDVPSVADKAERSKAIRGMIKKINHLVKVEEV